MKDLLNREAVAAYQRKITEKQLGDRKPVDAGANRARVTKMPAPASKRTASHALKK